MSGTARRTIPTRRGPVPPGWTIPGSVTNLSAVPGGGGRRRKVRDHCRRCRVTTPWCLMRCASPPSMCARMCMNPLLWWTGRSRAWGWPRRCLIPRSAPRMCRPVRLGESGISTTTGEYGLSRRVHFSAPLFARHQPRRRVGCGTDHRGGRDFSAKKPLHSRRKVCNIRLINTRWTLGSQ